MALSTQYKVNQLAKDLEIKTKEIVDLVSGTGIEVKTQKALTPEEFGVVINLLTKANQIDNIDEYLDGVTYIPSKIKEMPKEEKKAEPEAPAAEAPKAEEKPAPVKEEKKPEAAPEVKAEAKPEVKSEPKAEKKPEPKVEVKVEKKPEVKPEVKIERKPEQKFEPKFEKKPEQKFEPRNEAREARSDNRYERRPDQQGRPAQQNGYQQKPQQTPYGQRPAQDRRPDQQGGYNQRPQQNQQGGQKPFRDKDEMGSQRVPREKFQPKAIVREQTPKGTVVTQKHGATRVVDTRGTTVDLSKYDERLDNFVPDSVRDDRGGSQKLKKNVGGNRAPVQKDVGGNRMPIANKKGNNKKAPAQPVKKQQLHIQVPDEITVGELASRLQAKAGDVVKKLMLMGVMASVNQTIDYDTAYFVADEMGAICEKEVIVTIEDKLFDEKEDSADDLVERAPVVCVMGHVDHGKTSLLDAIRNTHVTSGEAGGITQHIGAYRVSLGDKDITFLDTPGHEAFTAMRARGAMATDIAILVVAADDGIMPQTVEAINHAKQAGVQIIVAINKMDKPTANPDAVKQELTKYELVPEEWGGDVMCVPVSALTHQGIDDLLERVLLIAEVEEYKANPNRRAKGIVIESKLDRGRGPVATILVQNGTLHNGDIVIAGTAVGRVRSMADHNGRLQNQAGPSVPVEITGLADVPEAGDEFIAVENERMARELADQRRAKAKEAEFKANSRANLNDLFAQIAEGVKDLNIIVKADVAGSVEAVKQSLEKISNDEVKVKVIHAAAGAINEGDVTFAAASNAIIVGFNVRPDKTAIDSAERQNVEVRTYRVIYECIEEITAAMKGMLAPKFREVINGHAEVRQTIHVPNVGTIAGSYIQDGKIGRNNFIRVLRDGIVIFEDKISSLRRFKDDVKEVAQGFECGVGLEKFNDIKVGDILEAYFMEEVKD